MPTITNAAPAVGLTYVDDNPQCDAPMYVNDGGEVAINQRRFVPGAQVRFATKVEGEPLPPPGDVHNTLNEGEGDAFYFKAEMLDGNQEDVEGIETVEIVPQRQSIKDEITAECVERCTGAVDAHETAKQTE